MLQAIFKSCGPLPVRRRRSHANRQHEGLRSRPLRMEPLEDRRLLSLAGGDDREGSGLGFDIGDAETLGFVPGEILVGFEGEAPTVYRGRGAAAALDTARGAVQDLGLHSPSVLMDVPAIVGRSARLATRWQLTPGADVAEIARQLAGRPGVAYAEPNYVWSADVTPNDPRFGELWGMHNTGQTGGQPDADIDAPEAWDIAAGSQSIVAAVIDTGVDYNHPDLAANIWTNPGEVAGDGIDNDGNGFVDDVHGWDFVNGDSDPMDDNGHGTHVSGTIAAVGDNAAGVAGVNWSGQVMALKFLNSSGSGPTSAAVAAVNYAAQMRSRYGVEVRLTSNSWGGGSYSQALYDAIAASGGAGMLFIAAAGNSNSSTPQYPAGYDLGNVISVAATDHNDLKADFSNYDADWVDLGAPGVDILSTVPGGNYELKSGTSMAAPHVAGVAALAWSMAPDASPETIKQAIFAGAEPIAAMAGITLTGGRLNAYGTLQQVGMTVAGSSPASGEIVTSPPQDFVTEFSFPVAASSLAKEDLTVNGKTADSVALSEDRLQATFHFNDSPVMSEGLQVMCIEGGAVQADSAIPASSALVAWEASFRYDAVRMQASTDPLDGSVVSLPLRTLRVRFNEPFDVSTIEPDDLLLSQGAVTGAVPDDSHTMVEYTLDDVVAEGTLAVVMAAGAVRDVHGNPMLGYDGRFDLDFDATPFPAALAPKEPRGSLIYAGATSAFISYAGDVDRYLIDLAEGQTVTVVVDPQTSLQPAIELFGPSGQSLGTASAGAAGAESLLQTVPAASSGAYTVAVSGVDGSTGVYTVQVILNAALEAEAHGGPGNDSRGTAQNIDGGFLSFTESAERAAVVGQTEGQGGLGPDGFGYEAVRVPFTFEDISGTGNGILAAASDDDAELLLRKTVLNGFTFGFYGQTYNQVIIGSNGQITFEWDGTSRSYRNNSVWNYGLNDTPMVATIAPFWDDLEIVGPEAMVYWEVLGEDADQRLIVQWDKIRFWDGSAPRQETITFQAILYEGDGSIQLNYLDLDSDQAGAGGATATVGIKDVGIQGPNRLVLIYDDGPSELVGTGISTRIRIYEPPTPDCYAMTLAEGETATLALTDWNPEPRDALNLELQDASGATLVPGGAGTANIDRLIDGFVAPSTGTYYALVTGLPRTQYSLVVTRNAAFDAEKNDTLGAAQDLAGRQVVLGAITSERQPDAGVIESFDDGAISQYAGNTNGLFVTAQAAHDGPFGLQGVGGWIYRNDPAVCLEPGDVASAWIQSSSPGDPLGLGHGMGYFGFAAGEAGAFSMVMAPSQSSATRFGKLLIQRNTGYRYEDLAAVAQQWEANHWYRMEVTWSLDGEIVGRLYDSDGATLLNTVTAHDDTISSGGIAFRASSTTKFFDTVQAGVPNGDCYQVTLAEGQMLELATSTPLGGLNRLDPMIRLYTPSGAVADFDDNSAADGRNAALSYFVPAGASGAYFVEVVPSNALPDPAVGEYLLSLNVTTPPPEAGIAVNRTSIVTGEPEVADTFAVVLNTDPGEGVTVTIGVSSSDVSEGVAFPAALAFTGGAEGNWNVPQIVTVTGVDDFADDGDIAYTIITAPAVASDVDSPYHNMNASDLAAANLDDDEAGIRVTPGSIVTYEDPSKPAATFEVVLDSQPASNVTVIVESSDPDEGEASPAGLSFTVNNWNVPQLVTVSGVDDDPPMVDGDIPYTITLTPLSADPQYGDLPRVAVSATNIDDEQSSLIVRVIDDFEDGNLSEYTEKATSNASVTMAAAHDGSYGLQDETNTGYSGWVVRTDTQAQVARGHVISAWVRSEGIPSGRGYFGFGARQNGTLAFVMAPNTNTLSIDRVTKYDTYESLGSVSQTWLADHWYRMEVEWKTTGEIIGRLYDSDGATLLNTVAAVDTKFTSGGIAFRSFSSTKHFDTVELRSAPAASSMGMEAPAASMLGDQAALAITAGMAAFSGSCRPEGNLTALQVKSTIRAWTLEITGDAGRETGTFTAWPLFAAPLPGFSAQLAQTAEGSRAQAVDRAIDSESPELTAWLETFEIPHRKTNHKAAESFDTVLARGLYGD
ncbi:MAG: S8 family serine peptidase [Thermoguttaceae bacterium]|jgi:subtilisin family serine protease